MKKNKVTISSLTLGVLVLSWGQSQAATIENTDSTAKTIVVSEGISKRELLVAANGKLDFCATGCFVTFPNGDRMALAGTEGITISGNKVTLK